NKVGLGLAVSQGRNWSEQCAIFIMQYHMYLRNNQEKCHTGAKLPLWLNSMLAALSNVKDPDSKASNVVNVYYFTKANTYTKQGEYTKHG
ncbi:MAG: hypothetical protein ACKPKO_48890, partial [Candidatus Fonsibacter sp.]